MKKLSLLAIVAFSAVAFAQVKTFTKDQPTTKDSFRSKTNLGKNEFKVNALFLVLGAYEISFERILNQQSSIGVAIGRSFSKANFNYNYAIEPFYRLYFGKKPAAGLFVEGFGSVNSKKYKFYEGAILDPNVGYTTEDKTHFGLGVSVGGKYVTKNNIVFEVVFGIGQNFTAPSSKNLTYDGVNEQQIARGGISVGYRF